MTLQYGVISVQKKLVKLEPNTCNHWYFQHVRQMLCQGIQGAKCEASIPQPHSFKLLALDGTALGCWNLPFLDNSIWKTPQALEFSENSTVYFWTSRTIWHTPAFHGVSLTNHLDFSPHMLWLRWRWNPPKRWGRTCHQQKQEFLLGPKKVNQLQLWPWLPVITGDFYGIIQSINGVLLVLITDKWP